MHRLILSFIVIFICVAASIQQADAWQSAVGFKRVLPPRNLTYTSNSPTYTKWTAITSNTPTWSGQAVTSWSISPALPTGLSFNTSTGVIAGTPTSSIYSATHTVTAANAGGSTTRALTISVILSPYTWIGTTSNAWATGTNWYGGAAPSANTHVAIFDNECTQCNSSISSAVIARSIQMKNNYTGTITQVAGAGSTINLGTNNTSTFGGFTIDGGAFAGGTANIRADYLELNTGSFTSTSAELRLGFDANYGINTEYGFSISSTATFVHNNGTVYFDAQTSTGTDRKCGTLTLNQSVTFYNLDWDCRDTDSDMSYDSSYFEILGTSATMLVLNTLDYYDGFTVRGNIEFYGANVNFYCDNATSPEICSGVTWESFNGSNNFTNLIFKGASAQTYTFQDGAAGPLFRIENASGVTTPSVSGRFIIMGLNVQTGSFTAPPTELEFLSNRCDIRYQSNTTGFIVGASGSFVHNNGTVILSGRTSNRDARDMFVFSLSPKAVTFYNLTINQQTEGGNTGRELRETRVPFGTTITILNDYMISGGRLTESGTGTNPVLIIRGDYTRQCSNFITHACADEDNAVDKLFDTNGSNIYNDNPSETECNGCTYTFAPGAGNTVTINSGIINLRSTSANIVVTSGTLNIASGGGAVLGANLTNNAAITCAAGEFIFYEGTLSGTPGGGNDTSCYRTTPVDAIPAAVNWVDFSSTSASQTFSGLDHFARVQVSVVNVVGTPTMQYKLNGGADGAWVTIVTSTTLPVMNGHFIEFRVTGTSLDSGTFTIRNVTDSNNLLDTVTGTVP